MFQESPQGQTHYCDHPNNNTSGICDMCFGKPNKINNWREEFKKQFSDNVVWWDECIAEMRIGDPDFHRLITFIAQVERQAKLEAQNEIIDIHPDGDVYVLIQNNYHYVGYLSNGKFVSVSKEATLEAIEKMEGIINQSRYIDEARIKLAEYKKEIK